MGLLRLGIVGDRETCWRYAMILTTEDQEGRERPAFGFGCHGEKRRRENVREKRRCAGEDGEKKRTGGK